MEDPAPSSLELCAPDVSALVLSSPTGKSTGGVRHLDDFQFSSRSPHLGPQG